MAGEVDQPHGQARGRVGAAIGDAPDVDRPLLLDGLDQHRREEAARGVVQRLPAAVVVDAGPGGDRPAVVELPVEAPQL